MDGLIWMRVGMMSIVNVMPVGIIEPLFEPDRAALMMKEYYYESMPHGDLR